MPSSAPPPRSHHAGSPDTFQEGAAVAGGEETLLAGSLGPWRVAEPARCSSPVPACQLACRAL